MSGKSFTTIKAEVLECNKLPEKVKEILNIANNSLIDLDDNDIKQFWILLHDFIKETSVLEETINDIELLTCYQCILNIIVYVINCEPEMLNEYEGYPMKTITLFQYLYSKQFKFKFKLEIVKMYMKLWQFITKLGFDQMAEHFIFTFNFIFDNIKVTTKKYDMKTLSTLLWEFCKGIISLSSNQTNLLNLIVSNLELFLKCPLFLETEAGKRTIADIFTANQQLFLRLHGKIKTNLSKSNKLETEAYGEIYFIAWINSNASMRDIIEEGIFDIISKTLVLKRTGLAHRTYRNALILLQSVQYHRKHLLFSKVITKLYAPVLWRQLMSEFSVIRCNATDILARAYPLEKRGEGREVSSLFIIKQQDAFLNLLEDNCPQVRIAAIKGICSCMRYFWDTFEDEWIHKYFKSFAILIDENVYEVRRTLYYGFCQLLDECKSHTYFKNPLFITKMKNSINDDNEKVRRAFINFLLKIKKVDNQLENVNKINFAKIVNLHDTASALAREDKQNGTLIVDLIFDNFIGDKVPNKNATLMRFNMFYKINPISFRKLILYSEKHIDFNSAYELILSLLRTVYCTVKKKECLKNTDKENNSPAKKRKKKEDSENMSDSSYSSCYSSGSSNDDNEQNEHINVCCILDCVYCLMFVHHNALKDEKNQKQKEEINSSCTSCLIKLLKFYKEGDAYFSAMNLASLISATKLSVHLSVPSTAISTLKLLPNNLKQSEEVIDMRKVNCLINTLCMWKRGYEILQFVNVWFNEAFKTLNLNETQYPEAKTRAGKRVRFKAEECKPLTGILLINSMLLDPQTRDTLMNSDVNKNNIYDLFSYLQRVEAAIENRITSDCILNKLLSDEVLIELFVLKMRLHIIYYSYEKTLSVDEIIKFLTSTLDWALNNLLIHDLHLKDESTIIFAAYIIEAFNNKLLDCCLMQFVNNTVLEKFFLFCTSILHNYLGPRVLISIIKTLVTISKHLYYQKQINKLVNDISIVTDCICRIISVLSETKYNEQSFKSIIGDTTTFRHELAMLILEINKINAVDFKTIFTILIETIINIIGNKIREIDEVDVYELLTEMPFAAYQLTAMILNNAQLRNHFSSHTVIIFSSDIYKNVLDCIMLLSSISFVYTLSFQIKKTKISIKLEPIVKLLYKSLLEFNLSRTPLLNDLTVKNLKNNQDMSILETSDFSNHQIVDFQQKGRTILVSTAKQLRINLCD